MSVEEGDYVKGISNNVGSRRDGNCGHDRQTARARFASIEKAPMSEQIRLTSHDVLKPVMRSSLVPSQRLELPAAVALER